MWSAFEEIAIADFDEMKARLSGGPSSAVATLRSCILWDFEGLTELPIEGSKQ